MSSSVISSWLGRALDDAVARVLVEQAERDLVERGLDRADLGQDVDAVAVVLDHPLDAADLALDALHALEQLVLRGGVAALRARGSVGAWSRSIANPPGVSGRVRPQRYPLPVCLALTRLARLRRPARRGLRRGRARRRRHRPARRATPAAEEEGGHMAAAEPHPVRGLAVAEDGLRLVVDEPELRRGRAERCASASSTSDGDTVRDFDVEHEKRMHLIVARRDLTGFQHLHPTQGADGTWTPDVSSPTPAPTACSPTSPATASRTRSPPTCASTAPPTCAPLPAPAATASATAATTSGSTPPATSCASRSRATASRSRTEPYLGAGGHLVALREGDLAFLHVHPTGDDAALRGRLPHPRPLPPVPPVQARGPRPHRRVHRGGALSMAAEHLELPITGMTCASCANRIERRLNELDGVTATVNYATEKATVDFDAAAVAPDALVAAVEAAGYQAVLPTDEPADEPEADETAPLRRRLLISALLSAPGARALDDPGAAVRQLAVARRSSSPRR